MFVLHSPRTSVVDAKDVRQQEKREKTEPHSLSTENHFAMCKTNTRGIVLESFRVFPFLHLKTINVRNFSLKHPKSPLCV